MLGNRFAIHSTIDKRAIFGAVEIPGMESLCDIKIGDLDVPDRLLIVAIVEDGMAFGLTRRDMTYLEILVLRGIVAAAITKVIGFETKNCPVCLFDGDVADMHVADETATILVLLEIERILHRANADAVHPDSLYSTTHLRTDAETVAFALEVAATDDDAF